MPFWIWKGLATWQAPIYELQCIIVIVYVLICFLLCRTTYKKFMSTFFIYASTWIINYFIHLFHLPSVGRFFNFLYVFIIPLLCEYLFPTLAAGVYSLSACFPVVPVYSIRFYIRFLHPYFCNSISIIILSVTWSPERCNQEGENIPDG